MFWGFPGPGGGFAAAWWPFFEGPTSPLQRPSLRHPGVDKGVPESLWKGGFGVHFWCFIGVVKVAVSLQREADLTPNRLRKNLPESPQNLDKMGFKTAPKGPPKTPPSGFKIRSQRLSFAASKVGVSLHREAKLSSQVGPKAPPPCVTKRH